VNVLAFAAVLRGTAMRMEWGTAGRSPTSTRSICTRHDIARRFVKAAAAELAVAEDVIKADLGPNSCSSAGSRAGERHSRPGVLSSRAPVRPAL